MASKKSVKVIEYQDDKHIDDKGILYCVKTQWWEDGLLQFTEEKKFFKKEKEAREQYSSVSKRGYKISLSVYRDGNERTLSQRISDQGLHLSR